MNTMTKRLFIAAGAVAVTAAAFPVLGDNPFLPLWEYIPDGEPHVFEDPANPGKKRVYLYGSHDTRKNGYCGFDLVTWSAPVDDLDAWRFDGVIFKCLDGADGKPLHENGSGDLVFAPDVVEMKGADGKKTYYLYPNIVGERNNLVTKSDNPAGPFIPCNWSKDNPRRAVGCMGFDPAVLVDDDGRVYGYWGGLNCHAAELDPATMATVKPGTQRVDNLVGGCRQEDIGGFYEASSIRKVKDKYVFIYSRYTKPGEFGMPKSNYTLAYAYAEKPLGPYTYGGTIIDGRGRERLVGGEVAATAHPTGNTHGSICEIDGKWYVFYHRQTGLDQFSRQAMVAPVDVRVEEGPGGRVYVSEAEFTSEGFHTDGLDPFERHAAGIACHYTGPAPATDHGLSYKFSGPWPEPFRHKDAYSAKDPYGKSFNRCRLAHCTDGSVAGYKYFNFDKTRGRGGIALELNVWPEGNGGKMEVWLRHSRAEMGGEKIGEGEIPAESDRSGAQAVSIPLPKLAAQGGRVALYFVFKSAAKNSSICSLEDFRFTADASM